jgi:hypothetical protein
MGQLFTRTCKNQITSWLVHTYNIFGAWTNHGQTRTHKTHHDPDLGEASTFPFIVLSVHGHGPCTQMSFCPRTPKLGVSKFSKCRLLRFWKFIIFCVNVQLRWGPKQSCSPRQELFKICGMPLAHHLNTRESRWFPTFSGRESNCQFDSRPFFWP